MLTNADVIVWILVSMIIVISWTSLGESEHKTLALFGETGKWETLKDDLWTIIQFNNMTAHSTFI